MPNRLTFHPTALFATLAFVATLGLARYAETRSWAIAVPLAWVLHGLVSGHFHSKSDDSQQK
jgi:hypothetical protein